ncbi:MAG: zinc ribbon domain-containing protein [Deltaproteobacteria bacterium]|nr:zinc ribbon domain-containing protein [Deltaproteobacteria bacterium]
MPIYEFRCAECGEVFEKLFMGSDEKADFSCPKCSAYTLEKVASATNYALGVGPGDNQPKTTRKSSGIFNACSIPGTASFAKELPRPLGAPVPLLGTGIRGSSPNSCRGFSILSRIRLPFLWALLRPSVKSLPNDPICMADIRPNSTSSRGM